MDETMPASPIWAVIPVGLDDRMLQTNKASGDTSVFVGVGTLPFEVLGFCHLSLKSGWRRTNANCALLSPLLSLVLQRHTSAYESSKAQT